MCSIVEKKLQPDDKNLEAFALNILTKRNQIEASKLN